MKKIDMAAIGTIAMFACLLFCTPTLANYNFAGFPVVTRDSGTVNGGVFIDSEPWAATTTLTGNFNVPTGNDVIWARLYTGIWGGTPEYEGWVNVTFNGVDDTNELGPIHLQGQNDVNPNVWCSGYGKHWMYYNVTDLVTAGAVNTAITKKINATVGNFDGRVYGIVLVVVYEGGDDPKNIQYWINDGSDGLNANTPHNAGTTDFAGSVAGSVTSAKLTMVHLTAYEPPCANCLWFNGTALDTSMVDSNTFEFNSWDVTGDVESSGNDARYSRGEDPTVSVCNAILTLVSEELPDLNVTAIELNCGYLFGNETNEICATVVNNGTADAGAFNVSFEIDGYSTRRKVNGLAAGENVTVCITYPVPRNAGDSVLITVTADSDAEIDESNETNNVATLATTVVNNGYKGKAYTGGSDITTWNTFDLKGDLLYSVGDSYYLSSYSNPGWTTYTANWTRSNLPVPGTATMEEVRLYVIYTWDKAGVMPDEVSLTFNGIVQTPDAHYSDEKGWATSYPYGMLAYDVTDAFDTSGNTAVFTNSHPGGDNVSMRGMLLVVVYADVGEPQRKIFVNEEFDILYGGVGECTTPAEATAWAPFGAIDLSQWDDARLITVAPGANANEGDLIFNWNKWTAVWNDAGSTQICIDDRKVSLYLQSADNIAGFQSDGDYMEASNAFLILEKSLEPKPDIWVDPTSFDVTLSTNTIQDYTIRIGNDGEATLMYDISDDETTSKAVVHSEVSEEAVVEALVESDEHTIELIPSRSIRYPISWIPHQISYDDGTAESYYAWSYAGGEWAVRFTPPSYPVDLDTARICLRSRDEDYEPFYIEVYDDDGAEGSPGTLLGTVMTIATADGWHDVDISGLGITITSGDFYIAYMQLTDYPKCEMLGCDKTDPQGRSWGRHSGSTQWGTWWPQCNWMIRCVVDLPGYCPWLDENPKSGSVPSGNYNEITVTIDTTGLARGDYSAKIIIANNDPDEDPTIVPVDLRVTEEKPDLIITEKWLCWPDNCTICYNVTNIGDGTAPACHNTTLYVDSVAVAYDHVSEDLAPGESYIGCFKGYVWAYTSPSDNITVCADNNESLDELDETNNCLPDIWMCGDVRKDGYVTAWDVAVLNSYVAGIGELEVERKWAGDVRTDGYITAWDVAVLNSKVAGIGAISCMCTQPDL